MQHTGWIVKLNSLVENEKKYGLVVSEEKNIVNVVKISSSQGSKILSQIVLDKEMISEGSLEDNLFICLNERMSINNSDIKSSLAELKSEYFEIILKEMVNFDVKLHFNFKHNKKKEFEPGDRISYAGRVFDESEVKNLVDASLDFWLTSGKYSEKFEKDFAKFLNVKYCSLVNSGSSANLLAFMSLTSPKLEDRRIMVGDEVITVAAGFPTTVAPILQYGAVPVFVDVTIPGYNIDCGQLEAALSDKTKAVMIAHTLGNPFDLKTVKKFCERNNLWLVEDNCDALGSKYHINNKWKFTGTIGNIGTSSFYPPHHMTMGEGGAVYTDNLTLKRIVDSFRDWGRDCWCPPGSDNTCRNRFTQKFGELPYGYDHKYVYSHFGYNLKVTDMQAAVGCAQLDKLDGFISKRKENWNLLREGLSDLNDALILPQPTEDSDPSWFGFLITLNDNIPFTRNDVVEYLEEKGIQTRMLFAGNLLKHPCFDEMKKNKKGYRTIGELKNTDKIMNDTFWIGVYPGMNEEIISYIVDTIQTFVKHKLQLEQKLEQRVVRI